MNHNIEQLFRAVADGDLQKAKTYVKIICANDTTEKNKAFCQSILRKLEMPSANMLGLPQVVKGLLYCEDVAVSSRRSRYYIAKPEAAVLQKVKHMRNVSKLLLEAGIRHNNSLLLYGKPGTGKSEFARALAYDLGVNMCYCNLSQIIDGTLGASATNVKKVFDYANENPCVLMLDATAAARS